MQVDIWTLMDTQDAITRTDTSFVFNPTIQIQANTNPLD